ncbi:MULTISPECIES: DUF4339 domain-containing protein [unclassified Flavobacterium]|uniref:DUF4339 domain-containing protein n=1 Tax=unclassified Flavobacterium TaxID=196869 RepID=UPI0009664596|nr:MULTISPECIES: DUF4339 domain-containing protein [unclassified Flavobacterium]MBN9285305.1 DUF4339 domain-containing protein [Flavobacterium sp.]OJV71980.1 MAG: hypothetical protein BGO42_01035 [Flavobacterium sp. 40-81]
MTEYFLHDGVNQLGPFLIDELESKNITKDTPVWHEGLDDWKKAGEIDALKLILNKRPPQFQKQDIQPPIHKTNAVIENNKGQSFNQIRKIGFVILLVLIVIFVVDRINYQRNQDNRINELAHEENIKASIRENIRNYVTAGNSNYQYRAIGGISDLKIFVTNGTNYLLDNVKVKVSYIKADGNVWDSKVVDFNILQPSSTTTIDLPDTNRGTSVRYEIVSIKSSALGLN